MVIKCRLPQSVWVIWRLNTRQFIGLRKLGQSEHQFGFGLTSFANATYYTEPAKAQAALDYLRATPQQRKLSAAKLAALRVRRADVQLAIKLNRKTGA
jgi:hypothetical protein